MTTSLSPNLDEILRLGAMSSQYENKQMGLANAFRGMVGLRPVSGVGGNFGSNLRASLGIQQKEVEDTLSARMAQQDYADKKAFRKRWVDEGFSDEYDNIYEVILERVLPKQFSREKSRLDIAKRGDEKRIGEIHSRLLQETTTDSVGAEIPIRSQKEYEERGRELFPEFWKLHADDLLKLFRQHKAGAIAEANELRTVRKSAAERQGATYFGKLKEEWDKLSESEQTNAAFNKLVTKWTAKVGKDRADETEFKRLLDLSFGTRGERATAVTRREKLALDDATQYVIDTTISGVEGGMSDSGAYSNAVLAVRSGVVSGKYDDQEAVRRLKALGYNVVPLTKKEQVALDSAQLALRKGLATEETDIRKAQVAFDKAEIDLREARELSATKVAKAKAELRKTQGLDYKEGLVRMNKVADDFEGENNPDRYPVAQERVNKALKGLNLDGSQTANIQSALAIRLHHLATPYVPAGAKLWFWAYKAADPAGKTVAEQRVEIGVLREVLKKHYRVDFEMLGMMGPGSWYAENINQVVESAIEALTPDAESKPIRELKGTGKIGRDGVIDRLLVNRLPTADEIESFAKRGIIYIITINGVKKKIILQSN